MTDFFECLSSGVVSDFVTCVLRRNSDHLKKKKKKKTKKKKDLSPFQHTIINGCKKKQKKKKHTHTHKERRKNKNKKEKKEVYLLYKIVFFFFSVFLKKKK